MAQHAAVAYSAIQQVNRASSGACPQANPLSDSQIELNYGSGCTTETGQTYRGRVRITRSDQSVYTVEFFNFDTGANGSVSGTCTLRSQSSAAQMELSADLVVQSPSCVAQFTLQGYLALQASGAVQWSGTGVYTSPYTGRTICHFESVVVERSCPTPLSGKVQVSSSTAVAFEVYHTACGVATLREGMDTHREEWTSSTIAYPCQPPTIRP
ncbi:MAG: hypothetical protein NZ874_08040 [Fimbriimonadales bacterium]|nr:hypothetical protein [Fimbriimonadales bacterium]